MTLWIFSGCPVCLNGALYQEPGERDWTCLQCSRQFTRIEGSRTFTATLPLPPAKRRSLH